MIRRAIRSRFLLFTIKVGSVLRGAIRIGSTFDSRYSDTPGQSFTLTPDRRLIDVQAPERKPASYLRVIPNWVEQMKRAVDEANR